MDLQRRGRYVIGEFGAFEYPLADRYRFEEELGHGSMGTVYRAQDLRLERPVAIKLLHPALTSELGIRRFQSEIRIAAALQHPNIVAVHDCGEANGRLFYVMDHLAGETLRARLEREKQLALEDALHITEQVADALQCAHDRQVVHRDIKPENIILTAERAYVVDFGLARVIGTIDAERLTASGITIGTPMYLSPEQAQAQKNVGPPADQYALACMLYEMLAGTPPFDGPTPTAIAMRHVLAAPTPLHLRRESTPVPVHTAVMRALEKSPADRFSDVSVFSASLKDSLRDGGGVVERSSDEAGSTLWRRLGRHLFGGDE
jgi:eukaryotic-like serine/threonine-protein kinase